MNKKQKQAIADLMKEKPVWCAAVGPNDWMGGIAPCGPGIVVGVFNSKTAANRWVDNRDDRMDWFVSELKLIDT